MEIYDYQLLRLQATADVFLKGFSSACLASLRQQQDAFPRYEHYIVCGRNNTLLLMLYNTRHSECAYQHYTVCGRTDNLLLTLHSVWACQYSTTDILLLIFHY